MYISKIILYFFTVSILLTVLLPLIRKDLWIFRVFDYPRIQKFIITGIVLSAWFIFFHHSKIWIDWALIILLCTALLYLFYLIFPFTFLGKTMIDQVKPTQQKTMHVMVSNVYQYNTKYSKLLDLINTSQPDIVFLLETDHKWMEAVKELRKDYPHGIEIPQENTYGLLFYSKFPILKHEINYLIESQIPSIIADIQFGSQAVRVFGLHPTPPMPQENTYSTDRDAEILLVGKMAKKHEGPCLVMGDLNDVAWSYTTKLFLKASGLLDPRLGRGIYSTFHAKYFFLRWPLDHYFVSSHFRLVSMQVEKHIGSDHFPISIRLVIAGKDDEGKITADTDEKKLIEEKIEAGLMGDPR